MRQAPKKLLVVLVMVALWGMSYPTWAKTKVFTDRNGKTVYTETWSGGTSVVRDRNGRTLGTKTRQGNRVIYRDRNGRVIGTKAR